MVMVNVENKTNITNTGTKRSKFCWRNIVSSMKPGLCVSIGVVEDVDAAFKLFGIMCPIKCIPSCIQISYNKMLRIVHLIPS